MSSEVQSQERNLMSPWKYALPTPHELFLLRRYAQLSQTDVGDHLDVSRQTVGRWESGEISPSIETTRDLLGLYRATIVSG